MTEEITLWPMNKEFDIHIGKPNTYNFPYISIQSKDGKFLRVHSLRDESISDIMKQLQDAFPESVFIRKVLNLSGL